MPVSGPKTPRQTRWLISHWSSRELNNKRIFAHFFPPSDPVAYDGVGMIRARHNPAGLLSIDLVFTRSEQPGRWIDTVFHLSQEQSEFLRKAPIGREYAYLYKGRL